MLWTVLLGLGLGFFLLEALRTNCPKKSRPGRFYYTKKWLFRLMMWMNTRRQKKDSGKTVSQHDRKTRGYGSSVRDPEALEMCQPLEDHSHAIDTTYFNGFDTDGTSVAFRIARKHNRQGELWVLMNLPGIGFLQHPMHPDADTYNVDSGGYRAGGCMFKVIEPMRIWRVTYNGLLRLGQHNDFESKPDSLVNVKVTFKWECLNDPFNFDVDLDRNLLADAIAKEKWTREFWDKLRGKHQTHYEQCGELAGTIEVEGHKPRKLFLKSYRDHTFGVRNWEMFERYSVHYIWIEEVQWSRHAMRVIGSGFDLLLKRTTYIDCMVLIGIMAMVAVLWMPDYITLMRTGYLMYGNGDTYPVTSVSLDLEELTRDKHPPDRYSFNFEAGGEVFHVLCQQTVTPEVYHYDTRISRVLERFCTYRVNGRSARGLTEYHYRNPDGPPRICPLPETVPLLREPDLGDIRADQEQITLSFLEEGCKSSLLTGGKGAQLALLTAVQDQVGGKVTKGFCLTLAAFELQLKENPEISESFDKITQAIREERLGDLKDLCSQAEHLLVNCKIAEPIRTAVTSELQAVFGDQFEQISLAIRSSAAGEDGGEASSAGQMETYLGVQGLHATLESIRKCWASAYTYLAVEYRRQHGQPVRTSMSVVLQEMVRAEVSGVMFTNDPLTGNTNRMVIDASYGLGEVVVSGKTTPDTIIIQRCHDNTLNIIEKRLGNKGLQMEISDSGDMVEHETEADDKSHCCLTDKQILSLARTGIKIETLFGNGRDIEWAISDGHLYLLQARPITTMDQESDEDLIHEFDSPVSTGTERITIGNIGEMMPGCVTPLTGSVFRRAIDFSTSMVGADFGGGRVLKYASKTVLSNCGRLFLNLTHIAVLTQHSVLYQKKALEMNLIGSVLDDHTPEIIRAFGKQKKSVFSKIYNTFDFFNYIAEVYQHSVLYQKEALEMNLVGSVLDDHTPEMIGEFGNQKKSFFTKIYNAINFFIYLIWLGSTSPVFYEYKKRAEINLCGHVLVDHGLEFIRSYGKSVSTSYRSLLRFWLYLIWLGSTSPVFYEYKKRAEINLCGHVLADHGLEFIRSYGKSVSTSYRSLLRFWLTGNRKIKIADGWYERVKTYSVGGGCSTSAELHRAITEKLPDYHEVWETTVHKSARSGSYGGVVMGVVSGGKDEWSVENYSDVALLLSQCDNVYSAEVPMSMKAIAKSIKGCNLGEDFLSKTDKECVSWLQGDQCPASVKEKYTEFLQRHGHRCVREAEFYEKSWRVEPEKLMTVLKSILKTDFSNEREVQGLSLDNAVDQLQSPVSWLGKLMLRKWIVPKAKRSVGEREFGKSVAVDVSDKFKQAYWRLADMLFIEGRLPDRELMFFLTHSEIGHLIETRSAKLIAKAVRRRKLLPVQSAIEFPRICVGRPKPIETLSEEDERKTTSTLTGMPVSRGRVEGPARVVKSLQDADQIQKGDILIVSYTDVGWSPYFPLIGGLVTELGGLVSHGAVVAREYGLPCVVNVPGATHKLRTGDIVCLDGSKGAIHCLETS